MNTGRKVGRTRLGAGLSAMLMAGVAVGGALAQPAAPTSEAGASLEQGFQSPPSSARPRVWWHWMNGNITKDGIKKDLEWMHRVGIGGVQNFDAALATPQIVDKRLVYMTPEWKDAFRYAVGLADSLGLEFATAASPGWSETGGPWVQPTDAMKKLVWSELELQGGKRFKGALPPLPDVTGPYQDLTLNDPLATIGEGGSQPPRMAADALVLAVPAPEDAAPPAPRVSTLAGKVLDASGGALEVERGAAEAPGGVILEYDTPQTIRSASLFIPGVADMFTGPSLLPVLEVEDAGGWRKVTEIPVSAVPSTASFAPVTAKRFRLLLRSLPSGPSNLAGVPGVAPPIGLPFGGPPSPMLKVEHLRLSAEPRVNASEAKAGFAIADNYYALDATAGPDLKGVDPASVIDLTGRMSADGRLDWTPPKGRWRVLRLGWSLLGTTNHPATREATGLEVDKYDGQAVHRYLETYLGMYADAAGPDLIGQRGLHALVTDSIEVGAANWTPQILDQFQQLRGYDPHPWLPALTGVIVGSRSQSDAFLYDFRRTLADLLASQHYGEVADVAHQHGLNVYGEALESGRPMLGDDMTMRSHADVPMSALWTYPRAAGPNPTFVADMKGAASVAHIYGQNLVAAESMTAAMSPWAFAPADLKPVMDLELVTGVNRPVIHTSVHQPVDDKIPGLSLLIFGQYFNRHETWAEMAGPWIDYISRSAFMLQQGRNLADVGYVYGEEAPLTGLYRNGPPTDAPNRYAYDFVSADALTNQLKVEGSELVAPGGARYRVLYLGGTSREMTLPMLRRLAALAEAGATIVGDAPQGSPSLKDDPIEYAALVRRLWSGKPSTPVGAGRVMSGHDVEAALASVGVGPDFSYEAAPGARVLFLHRRTADGDIYFVDNRNARTERIEASFRVAGKAPEIWRADTGSTEPAAYRIDGAQTHIPLELGPDEAIFVVFRHPATAPSLALPAHSQSVAASVTGGWDVAFQPGRGAPAAIHLDQLGSLSDQADPGVKYFSGTATYRTSFTLPARIKPGARLMLDLGKVGDVAEVRVNGQLVGTAWKAPYQVDIGKAVHRGRNALEVRVADLWVNRLVGDAQPGVTQKITFTALPTYLPSAPLRPSGLIGPVTVLEETR